MKHRDPYTIIDPVDGMSVTGKLVVYDKSGRCVEINLTHKSTSKLADALFDAGHKVRDISIFGDMKVG